MYIVLLADLSYHSAEHPARRRRQQTQDHRRNQMHRIRIEPLMKEYSDEQQNTVIQRSHQQSPQVFPHTYTFSYEKTTCKACNNIDRYDRTIDKCLRWFCPVHKKCQ